MSDSVPANVSLDAPLRSAPGSPLGRTALLLHALSLVCVASAVIAATVLVRATVNDLYTFIAVIGSIAFVLNVWSLGLSVHAIRKSESLLPPALVICGTLIECSVISLLGWGRQPNWDYDIWLVAVGLVAGVPIVVPFFSLVFVAATARTMWSKSKPDSLSNLLRRWLKSFLLIGIFATVFLLPVPLFLYCVSYSGGYWGEQPTWQTRIAANMPDFVRDLAADSLNERSLLHFKQLSEGWMSLPRLKRYALNNNQLGAFAVSGLLKQGGAISLRYAEDVANGRIRGGGSIGKVAAKIICENSNSDRIRKYLTSAATDSAFLAALVNHLVSQGKTEFIPEFDQLLARNDSLRGQLLVALAKLLPHEEITKRWPEYLAHSDLDFRLDTSEAMLSFPAQSVFYDTERAALASTNPIVHRMALNRIYLSLKADQSLQESRRRWIELLYGLLDSPDLVRRRGAHSWLSIEMKVPQSRTFGAPTGIKDEAPPEEVPEPETEEEAREIKQLKTVVEQWLRNSDKHSK